ncbi:slit homolog 2 protein-like [Acropora muricata]|uniref:slit homolog 2 protein-like n=1 Tax=Acropora muricata TaxID=159855 RepID=UPI0034E58DB3
MKRLWLLTVTIFLMWTGYADSTKGKPRIVIPSQVTRTVPNFYVWCSSDGTPPIYMSLMNSSAILDEGVGRVKSRILIDGNYTCNASSEFGTDSKTFHVSVNDSGVCSSCSCTYRIYRSRPDNYVNCYGKGLTTQSLTNIPTTTTYLNLERNQITQLPEKVFSTLSSLRYL